MIHRQAHKLYMVRRLAFPAPPLPPWHGLVGAGGGGGWRVRKRAGPVAAATGWWGGAGGAARAHTQALRKP